ncbi:hypothetical protein GCM10011519_05720 [Marmoricola endophyticus]|uniref:Uncharacterized protein n=1 Tax=Marmoricola endophyticus TaxID=2040280 RepID=A0A917BEQ9_9ACTN|nr:hypothetical protein [Marmoricola endophyticus]GGF35144.1 hypothetical protein GCM10011519_05720 [Marmoricola endophyticus]
MSQQTDRQRARRDRFTPQKSRVRRRHAERLVAQVRDTRAQRDALVAELDLRAGRLLAEIKDIGWPTLSETAAACGLPVHEAARLRRLPQQAAETGPPSVQAPTVNASTATADDDRRRAPSDEEQAMAEGTNQDGGSRQAGARYTPRSSS